MNGNSGSHRAQQALKHSDLRYRLIFDHSNDAIMVIYPELDEIIEANAKACSMLEYPRDELLSTPISRIHPDEMSELMAFARSVTREGAGWTDELTCMTKLGERLPSEISAAVMHLDGKPFIITMIRDISRRRQAEETLVADLKVASRIQRSLIPDSVRRPDVDIEVRYHPLNEIGGDYLGIRLVSDKQLYLTMCDVQGHGISSALLASRVNSKVLDLIRSNPNPARLVWGLNDFINMYFAETNMFVTFICARIDLERHTLTYSSAGHPRILHRSAKSGTVHALPTQNKPIGPFVDCLSETPETEHKVAAGDLLVFYSDGVIESLNAEGVAFGQQRLAETVEKHHKGSIEELADAVLEAAKAWCSEHVRDDISLLVVKVK